MVDRIDLQSTFILHCVEDSGAKERSQGISGGDSRVDVCNQNRSHSSWHLQEPIFASLEGRQISQSDQNSYHVGSGQRHEKLEVQCLQDQEQEECGVLSNVWRTLGNSLYGGVRMGVDKPPQRVLVSCQTTKWKCQTQKTKADNRSQRKRQGQRKGQGQGQRRWRPNWSASISFPLCQPSHLSSDTLAKYGYSVAIHHSGAIATNHLDLESGIGQCVEEGLQRVEHAARCEGSSRPARSNRVKTGDQRPPHCHHTARQSAKSVERRAAAASFTPSCVDIASHRVGQDLGESVGGVPQKTNVASGSRTKGDTGYQGCTNQHPATEPGCRKQSNGGSCGQQSRRECGSQLGHSRVSAEKQVTADTHAMCQRIGSRANHRDLFRPRKRGSQSRKESEVAGRRDYGRPKWQSCLMMMGCFFSCPLVKEGSTQLWQPVEHVVEAYYDDFNCYLGAAGNVVLNPNPWNGELYEDFLNPLDASRAAISLRHEVMLDAENLKIYLPSTANQNALPRSSNRRNIEHCKVRFREEVDVSISFSGIDVAGIDVIFTHKQLTEWKDKPWKLSPYDESESGWKNDPQSHVFDRWCIVDQTPTRALDDENKSETRNDEPPHHVLKPNHGIQPDFDSIIPYRYRARNGQLLHGRTHAPPGWHENLFLRVAGDAGAVRRDDADELQVQIRTWIAAARTQLILPHRDMTVPAQLMIELESRVRRAWRDQIASTDRIRLTPVRPSPRIGQVAQPSLHILIEMNRPAQSQNIPILIAHRQIDANGPSGNIHWIPVLVESPVDMPLLHQICAPPCEVSQMLNSTTR